MMVSFVLSFFPRDVLDEILNLIESVSEDFLTTLSNYEKQHKEGTCKVLGRSVVFSAFYADFCFCSKLVIITTLNEAIVFEFCISSGKSLQRRTAEGRKEL